MGWLAADFEADVADGLLCCMKVRDGLLVGEWVGCFQLRNRSRPGGNRSGPGGNRSGPGGNRSGPGGSRSRQRD